MSRSAGDVAYQPRIAGLLFAVIAVSFYANPVRSMPINTTSTQIVSKTLPGCAVGDLVYMIGDEFTGSTPCDRCKCGAGRKVQCARQRCEPRPGCKAIHRPDHCCPTYQCECEQEGRVYGNGEKLVDPADPCRVCYCQGGEVVCRRIACFLRDDCKPRLVPGRCCPEYDNCPLRGVTTTTGLVSSADTSSRANITVTTSTVIPSIPKDKVKQEITIKEITPVSEIPVLTGVKIKEILPSSNIELAEYSPSKSPLIPREVSNDYHATNKPVTIVTNEASEIKASDLTSTTSSPVPNYGPTELTTKANIVNRETDIKTTEDTLPAKVSLSTQDYINSEIYSTNVLGLTTVSPSIATSTTTTANIVVVPVSTKAPVIEEEDTSFLDHNPAFPPLPDDLSVLNNHGDELIPEPSIDSEHHSSGQEIISTSQSIQNNVDTKLSPGLSISVPTLQPGSTEKILTSVPKDIAITSVVIKDSPLLNLRSAIPTEILNLSSAVVEDINGELDEDTTNTSESIPTPKPTATLYDPVISKTINEDVTVDTSKFVKQNYELTSITTVAPAITTLKAIPIETTTKFQNSIQRVTTTSTSLNDKVTTLNSISEQTKKFIPILNNSTQNPIQENNTYTTEAKDVSISLIKLSMPTISNTHQTSASDVISVDFEGTTPTGLLNTELNALSTNKPQKNKNSEILVTTETASTVDPTNRRKINALSELVSLIGDVASISAHTDTPASLIEHTQEPTSIPESEELIPVNAGYKSKNNNWNVNSITETPLKSKITTKNSKLAAAEIEDEEEVTITDSPSPFDKVEPTTKKPIIDNVSDSNIFANKTNKIDIEIIANSYVPSINQRPTKVVMKKNSDKAESDETYTEDVPTLSTELLLEKTKNMESSYEITTFGYETTPEYINRIHELSNLTSSSTAQ